MTIFVTTANQTNYQPATGVAINDVASLEQIVVVGGAAVRSNNAFGILGKIDGEQISLVLMGSVLGGNNAGVLLRLNNNKVLIGSSGAVFGVNGGILLSESGSGTAGNNLVENQGVVSSTSGIGISAKLSNNYIANLGTVDAIQGIVSGSASSSGNTIVNSGSIYSLDVGVTLYGGGSYLNNSGLIRANSLAVAVDLQANEFQTVTVRNSGTIESGGSVAIQGHLGNDKITNTGTIIGGIDLGDGNDLYDGRGGTINGSVLLGAGSDSAYGGSEGETFFGDAGDDFMDGGSGDDTFNIDVTDPNASGGQDTASGGTGNDTFNLKGGISPQNVLNGGEGADWVRLKLGSFPPATTSNAVIDLRSTSLQKVGDYWGSLQVSGIENVSSLDGDDVLIGNNSNNTLFASAGSDTLEGGLGDDVLDGASGFNFARFTGSTSAKVNLANLAPQVTGYGTDTFISITGLIGGSGGDSFIGSGEANAFYGYAGKDSLSGAGGMDTLSGGLGNDKLTGGTGADIFVFNTKLNTKTNVDTITDFKAVDDTIRLENAIFKKLTKAGPLNKNNLAFGAKAKDKNDYLVYDKAKGALYYDADGSGKGAAVKFAQLVKNTALDYKDFIII